MSKKEKDTTLEIPQILAYLLLLFGGAGGFVLSFNFKLGITLLIAGNILIVIFGIYIPKIHTRIRTNKIRKEKAEYQKFAMEQVVSIIVNNEGTSENTCIYLNPWMKLGTVKLNRSIADNLGISKKLLPKEVIIAKTPYLISFDNFWFMIVIDIIDDVSVGNFPCDLGIDSDGDEICVYNRQITH